MARGDDSGKLLEQQAGRKYFVQKITVTTSGVRTDLSTTTAAAAMYAAPTLAVGKGAKLALICDQAFNYTPCPAGATTAVTTAAGATPGFYVPANTVEYVYLKGQVGETPNAQQDGALDIVAAAGGTLVVYLVQ